MKSFDTCLLYVLSGTGNTFRVARWIEDFFKKSGIKTQLNFIENADLRKHFKHPGQFLTIVMFPTHGFMPPWSMIKFLFKMPRQKKSKGSEHCHPGCYLDWTFKDTGGRRFCKLLRRLGPLVQRI